MARPLRVFVSAMEHSGDIYGAQLSHALRAREPGVLIEGIGGPEMEAAGVNVLRDTVSNAVMGIVEIARHLPRFFRLGDEILARIAASPPDALVVIDSPAFNFPLATKVRKAFGARAPLTVYCICPQIWAWKTYRVRRMKRDFDMRLVIFPFEPEWYRRQSCDATFIGHPLVPRLAAIRREVAERARNAGVATNDDVEQSAAGAPTEAVRRHVRRELGIADDETVIGLMPGSRGGEIRPILPVMIEAARRLWSARMGTTEGAGESPAPPRPSRLRFVVSSAPRRDPSFYLPMLRHAPPGTLLLHADAPAGTTDAILRRGTSYTAMLASHLAVVASGTVTVETTLMDTPMIIVYKGNPITAQIVRAVVNVPYVGMPNLIARRRIIPELLQWDFKPAHVEAALRAALDPAWQAEQRVGLAEVRTALGGGEPMEAAADALLARLQPHA